MQAATLESDKMNIFFHHLIVDYAGLGIMATIILTIPIGEIGAAASIISGTIVLIGQGIKWLADNKRKQERHRLFMDIGRKMMSGELKFDKEFLEKMDED